MTDSIRNEHDRRGNTMSQNPERKGDQKGEAEKQDQPWTVLRLLQWTTDFFRNRGSESPRLDAEVLLAHVRGCSRVELYTAFAEEPDEQQRVAFREMVRRRGEGMPVAQLVGYREFYSLRFRVTEATLIPRPETEHLVVEALDCAAALSSGDEPLQIADIGTGSGAIAVTLAKHLPGAQVVAVDRSVEALRIAAWNAEQHEVASQLEFIESDLLSNVQRPPQFDLICSNPPYVSEAEFRQLAPTVRDFEPATALVSGPKGTEVIERILEESKTRLKPAGRLIVELSPMIADACERLAASTGGFDDLRFIKDLAGMRRVLSLRRSSTDAA